MGPARVSFNFTGPVFEVMDKETACGGSKGIQTLKDCQAAATALSLNFKGDPAPGATGACFNRVGQRLAEYSQSTPGLIGGAKYNLICRTGVLIVYTIVYTTDWSRSVALTTWAHSCTYCTNVDVLGFS